MSSASPESVADDLGRVLHLDGAPARVVSLVPSITELVFDLGVGSRLVGLTRFCTHPVERVDAVEKIGGTNDPDCARIEALAPDLVLVDRDENRREDFERLEGVGIPVFVAAPSTVADAAETVARIGEALGCAAAGRVIAGRIRAAGGHGIAAESAVRVFCPIWRNPWMTFNRGVFGADVIRQAGGENVWTGDDAYARVELSAIAALDPEVVLLPDEPYLFRESHIESLAELRGCAAWRDGRIHVVDGKGLFWYGRRTPDAIAELAELLVPS